MLRVHKPTVPILWRFSGFRHVLCHHCRNDYCVYLWLRKHRPSIALGVEDLDYAFGYLLSGFCAPELVIVVAHAYVGQFSGQFSGQFAKGGHGS